MLTSCWRPVGISSNVLLCCDYWMRTASDLRFLQLRHGWPQWFPNCQYGWSALHDLAGCIEPCCWKYLWAIGYCSEELLLKTNERSRPGRSTLPSLSSWEGSLGKDTLNRPIKLGAPPDATPGILHQLVPNRNIDTSPSAQAYAGASTSPQPKY